MTRDCSAGCGLYTRAGGLCPLCRQHIYNARTALRQASGDDTALAALLHEAKRLAYQLGGPGDTGRVERLRCAALCVSLRDSVRLNSDSDAPADVSLCIAVETPATRAAGRPTTARNFASALRRALRFPGFAAALAAGLANADDRADLASPLDPSITVRILSAVWGRLWRFTGRNPDEVAE